MLEALAVTTPELEEAEAECEEVLDELRAELSQLGAALEASRAPLRERPKLQKQYADATARIEALWLTQRKQGALIGILLL